MVDDSDFYNRVRAFSESEHFATFHEMMSRNIPNPNTVVGISEYDTLMKAACLKYKCELYDDILDTVNTAMDPSQYVK